MCIFVADFSGCVLCSWGPYCRGKNSGPIAGHSYLGLEIDTVRKQIRVPDNKVQSLRAHIVDALSKSKLTLRQLQSLLGSLNFVCKAIAPGRAFTRRLIALTCGLRKPHRKVRVSVGAKLDLLMWLEFFEHFNGVCPFRHLTWSTNDSIELFTDAAASIGYGGFFRGRWFQARWPHEIVALNPSIALLEFFPIVVAVHCWGSELANRKVMFRTDNVAVVHIINKQSSRCDLIMHLLHLFVCQCLRYNITFKARHVPGIHNVIADSLSRFQVERFRAAAPQAELVMTPIPKLPLIAG